MRYKGSSFQFLILFISAVNGNAQDLDPRAYVRGPINANFLVTGYSYSHGGIVTDASLPFSDVRATVHAASIGAGHMFSLFGQTAQVTLGLPYVWADVSGSIGESTRQISRTGFSDMRLRMAFLFHGAPAATAAELAKATRRTILGTSLSILAPTGQYFPEKLINLGTNRWSFKPELALSEPVGERWLFDVYAGLYLYTTSYSFYPGDAVREQKPVGSFQTHISYTIQPGFWGAFNATFYTGGKTTVNGIEKDDWQSNSRIGATVVLPVKKRHSVKLAFSTGAIVTRGANFTTLSAGWQTLFL